MNEALHQEIATLRARNEFLEAELALRDHRIIDGKIVPLMNKFRLTKQEATCLLKLSEGRPVNKYWLSENIARKEDVESNLAAVIICKIRQKITPIEIKNLWGVGYCLEGENLHAVRAVIGGAQ